MFTDLVVNLSDDPNLAKDLEQVVISTAKEFAFMFPWPPPAGVRSLHVFHRRRGPLVYATRDSNAYEIVLSVSGRYYCQLVFQLGHELGHIMADPRRSNWFVESCCEMVSLALLHRMSNVWASSPPYPNWAAYAPQFQKYAEDRIQEANTATFKRERQADRTQLSQWLTMVGHPFRPLDRQRNVIIAEMLRPRFEESADNWQALQFLGEASGHYPWTSLGLNGTFRFDRWWETVPEHLRDLVQKISALFENMPSSAI